MPTEEDFSQRKGVTVWVRHHDKADSYNRSILRTRSHSDLTGKQSPCDFLIKKLQKEMQVHYLATMLHPTILHPDMLHPAMLHPASGVECGAPRVLHTEPAALWEEPNAKTLQHSRQPLLRKLFPTRVHFWQSSAYTLLRKPLWLSNKQANKFIKREDLKIGCC